VSENDAPEPLNRNDDKLQTVIKKAEAEVQRVQEWMAREQTGSGRRRGGVSTRGQAESNREGEPWGGGNAADSAVRKQSVETLRQLLGDLDRAAVMAWRRLAIVVVVVIIAAVALILNSNRNTQAVIGQLEQSKLIITNPPEGANVGIGQKVRGITPYSDLNHYVVVTMVRTGSVQIGPAAVSTDGTFTGDPRFSNEGIASAGEGDEFTIRVLATRSGLEAGNLTSVPDDAILSRPLTVRHTKPSGQIVISTPVEGADVSLDEAIAGKTSLPDLNHYIVVKFLKVGTSFVQDQPALVNRSDSTFSGKVRLGGTQVAIGEQFAVSVLATKATLPAALLANPPADAVFSKSVTVTRKR
jgi:hypothetical protein